MQTTSDLRTVTPQETNDQLGDDGDELWDTLEKN